MEANRKKHFHLNDHTVVKVHDYLYSRQKYPLLFFTLLLYYMIILLAGEHFEISTNYFIIFPIIVSAISFGFWGGLISGILGLPANLFGFFIIGHMEYAPASLIMAELAGIVFGASLGYMSDFFTKMKMEMRRRRESELALEKSLKEKDILLKEINHRVKNNLNLIKSLIQLQSNRLEEGETHDLMIKMRDRIIAIAMVQDLLYDQDSLEMLDLNTYTEELLSTMLQGFHGIKPELNILTGDNPLLMESRKVTYLGIIINEVITNITKYAVDDEGKAEITIELKYHDEMVSLSFRDKGPGYPDQSSDTGLGFKLIRSLLTGLGGHLALRNKNGGELILHFPL